MSAPYVYDCRHDLSDYSCILLRAKSLSIFRLEPKPVSVIVAKHLPAYSPL